jgi:hypothetical protein
MTRPICARAARMKDGGWRVEMQYFVTNYSKKPFYRVMLKTHHIYKSACSTAFVVLL